MNVPSDLREQLLASGVLISTGVDGLYGKGAVFEDVLEALDALVTREGRGDKAERVRFPPAMPRDHFEHSEYLKGFPQFAGTIHCFCGDEKAHREMLRCIAEGEDWTKGQVGADVVLAPAACYEVYPMLSARGALPDGGALVDVMSWCFRREPSKQPTRMQMFRMREYVRIGTPEAVAAFRADWMERGKRMISTLQLPHHIEVANDPFFGRPGRLKADIQKAQEVKFELVVPVNDGDGPTAVMSFNYHQDHFGTLWNLAEQNGAVAHTACVAFGLERLTLAMLKHHGIDLEAWPASLRAALWP